MWLFLPLLIALRAPAAEPPDESVLAAAADPMHIPGCHRVEMAVALRMGLGLLGADHQRTVVQATLAEGLWRDLAVVEEDLGREGVSLSWKLGEQELHFLPPLVGRFAAEGEEGGDVQELISAFQRPGQVVLFSADTLENAPAWRVDRILRVQNPKRGREREVHATSVIAGDPLRLRRWEAKLGGLPLEQGRIQDAEVQVQLDADGVPTQEQAEVTFRLGLIAVRFRQQIQYRRLGSCSEGAPAGAPTSR